MRIGRRLRIVALLCLCILSGGIPALTALAGSSPEDLITDATRAVREMSQQEDAVTMASLLQRAKGVAIFPKVIKAGLIIGISRGKGLVLRRDAAHGRWYGPSFTEIGGLSYGAQIGIQSIALLLVVTNEQGMEIFDGAEVTLGGEFAVAAGPVGRQAHVGTNVELSASIYHYSLSKGLFIGVTLEGAKIDDLPSTNKAYWGADIAPATILETKEAGPKVKPVIDALKDLLAKS